MRAVYKKINQIARDFKPSTREVKKDDDTVVWDSKETRTVEKHTASGYTKIVEHCG